MRNTHQPDSASLDRQSLLQITSSPPDGDRSSSQPYICRRFKNVQKLEKTHLPVVADGGLYTGLAVLERIKRPTLAEELMLPYEDAMPCHKCEAITVEALLSPKGYRHGSLIDISVTAGYGCKLCDLMFGEIDRRDLNEQEFCVEPVILRLANSTGTAYCQDELWVTVRGKAHAKLGLYTDNGK
jgi:hypothetical protein